MCCSESHLPACRMCIKIPAPPQVLPVSREVTGVGGCCLGSFPFPLQRMLLWGIGLYQVAVTQPRPGRKPSAGQDAPRTRLPHKEALLRNAGSGRIFAGLLSDSQAHSARRSQFRCREEAANLGKSAGFAQDERNSGEFL